MKKTMTNLMIAAAFVAAAANVASAQTLKANIPFAFRAGDKVMAPGSYHITVRIQRNVVTLNNDEAGESALVMAGPATDPAKSWSASGSAVLAFECAGSRCSLAQIYTGGAQSTTIPHPRLSGGEQATLRVIPLEKVNGD